MLTFKCEVLGFLTGHFISKSQFILCEQEIANFANHVNVESVTKHLRLAKCLFD